MILSEWQTIAVEFLLRAHPQRMLWLNVAETWANDALDALVEAGIVDLVPIDGDEPPIYAHGLTEYGMSIAVDVMAVGR